MQSLLSINLENFKVLKETAVIIGNFDGCHLGHKRHINNAKDYAQTHGLMSLAITFEPHPLAFFSRSAFLTLFTSSQKIRALTEQGVEQCIVLRFDEQLIKMSHQEFFEQFLLQKLRAKAIFIGKNFRFGHQRQGDVEYLKKQTQLAHIKLEIADSINFNNELISSTRIRHELARNGNITDVNLMLGHSFMLEGQIIEGRQLGRKIGFPTVNLGNHQQIVPKSGVYAGYVCFSKVTEQFSVTDLPKQAFRAAVSVGTRPTVDDSQIVTIEAHLIEGHHQENEHYGQFAAFYFHSRLRDELKFENLDQLKQAIAQDVQSVKTILTKA